METPEWVKNAKVGDKVVCVDNYNNEPLVIGRVYTVSGVGVAIFADNPSYQDIAFDVEGVKPIRAPANSFHWACFKPLKSTEKGMSILREILNNPHKEIEKSLEDA